MQSPSELFDQKMASGYDERNAVWAPEAEALHSLMRVVLAPLPAQARILCVGVGTGADILALAPTFPDWRFTAVEPAPAMLDVCRARLKANGLSARCDFHAGFLDTLAPCEPFDGATCLLVSQFILQPQERSQFFGQIARRLRPQGILVHADLAFDLASPAFEKLFPVWVRKMTGGQASPEIARNMRAAYSSHVAVLPPGEVESIVAAGGFETPVPFFRNLLIQAWFSQCALSS